MNINNDQFDSILNGCRKGERIAQKELYRIYYGFAMSIALRYSSNQQNAVEITNDAFFKVFKEVTKFLPRHEDAAASFKAWFKKILVNTSIDHFRKYHTKEIMATSEMGTTLLIDQQETAEDLLQYKEIIKLIQQLSPAYRAVFNLYIFEGFTHAEIAKTLKISEGSSKSNLFKARQHLQAFFKHNKSLNLKKEMTIC